MTKPRTAEDLAREALAIASECWRQHLDAASHYASTCAQHTPAHIASAIHVYAAQCLEAILPVIEAVDYDEAYTEVERRIAREREASSK